MGKLFGRSDDGGKKDSLLPRREPIEAPQDKQLQARRARVAEIEAARGAPEARPGLLARCGGGACRSLTLLFPANGCLFVMLALYALATSILVYLLSLEEVGVLPDTLYILEWLTVALNACLVGCAVLLFLHDPVDDELRDFFCCRRG